MTTRVRIIILCMGSVVCVIDRGTYDQYIYLRGTV